VSDAIVLRGVTAGYGAREVFGGLDLTVRRGELHGVIGPNGCGKTTLIRLVSGVLRPRAGTIALEGENVAASRPREIARRVAVVPQDTAPVFAMAALEIVLLGRSVRHPAFAFETGEDVSAARSALGEVGASHLEDREFTTLSGGERQRVILARALCQGGDVLLCDEPTAHLDMKHQAATFRLLRSLAAGGRTVLVVTHDVQLAAQACDRLTILGPLGVVAAGEPGAVVTRENLAAAFGIETTVHRDAAGRPLVLRHLESSEGNP
jgi:iron complex transport system ATP-binding protein